MHTLEKCVNIGMPNVFDHDKRKLTHDACPFLSFAHVFRLDLQDWENPQEMKPHAQKARLLLEDAMARDPANPWAIHLFTHLMEAGGEAEAAVAPAQKLQYLVPGAPHLQVLYTDDTVSLSVAACIFLLPSPTPELSK